MLVEASTKLIKELLLVTQRILDQKINTKEELGKLTEDKENNG
jgi:hypothetical protein